MKVIWKKAMGLLLAVTLIASMLAGCQGGPKKPDPVQEVLGYEADTVYFTVDGSKVTAGDYLFWLVQNVEYMNDQYAMMGLDGIDWEEDLGGMTAKDLLKAQPMETAKLVAVIEQMAKDEGFTFEKEDQEQIDETLAAEIEQMGGQESYDRAQLEQCVTDQSAQKANQAAVLYSKMYEQLFSEGGNYESSEEDLQAELEARKILRAKHILLLTSDAELDAEPYSDEKIAEKRQQAESMLAEIRASEDPDKTFNELMVAHSEDTGLAGNPDGYIFTTEPDYVLFNSRMVEPFEQGTMALEYGQISDVVESEHGFHIIQRLDPADDENFLTMFQSVWRGQRLDEMLQERMDAAEVETTEEFDQLDVQSFYEGLLEYRNRLSVEADENGAGEDGEDPAEAPSQDGDEGQPEDPDGNESDDPEQQPQEDDGGEGDQKPEEDPAGSPEKTPQTSGDTE